jgi:hypothetical protein
MRTSKTIEVAYEGPATGWAVYTRCEGDDPQFMAFFPERSHADAFMRRGMADSDSDDWLGCDGDVQVVPAALTHEGILAANCIEQDGKETLAREVFNNSDTTWA